MAPCQHGNHIGADFVGDISVGRDAVRADHHRVHLGRRALFLTVQPRRRRHENVRDDRLAARPGKRHQAPP